MGAPTPTARGVPLGRWLGDGFRTLINFAENPTVSLWEKSVQPPGLDGGDAVETTTMHNVNYRTMSSRFLKTMTESSVMAAYDPQVYDQLVALINVETTITVHMPNGGSLAFFGFLRTFEPAEHVEGTQPEATCTFTPTNVDPADGTEAAPVYTAPGTGT